MTACSLAGCYPWQTTTVLRSSEAWAISLVAWMVQGENFASCRRAFTLIDPDWWRK
jgi:hypothetical protein